MDKDGTIEELQARTRALQGRVAALQPSEDADARLIQAIGRCEASPADLEALARRLRPYVRAQILRGGWWRTTFEESAGKLSFVPTYPIEAAVEICLYCADSEIDEDDDNVAHLAREPKLDFKFLTKRYRGGNMAALIWKDSAERVLVREAIGDPTCRERRVILDEVAQTGEWSKEAEILASDRELRLVRSLWDPFRHYPIVSDDEAFPSISAGWT